MTSHPPSNEDVLASIHRNAFERGFDLVSATPLIISTADQKKFLDWRESGAAAEMAYMSASPEKRISPQQTFPGMQTALTFGVSYYQGDLPPKPGPAFGRVARYAWGLDYHTVIQERLLSLVDDLKKNLPLSSEPVMAVDTKPLLERSLAASAGIGFIGKNTMLISPRNLFLGELGEAGFHVGSWIFLCEVLIDIPVSSRTETPSFKGCGDCTKCMSVCPTGAIEQPGFVNANKCISYLTIENKGVIPLERREKIGNWLFGCDDCQDVCPFNARAFETRWPEFRSEKGVGPWISLRDVLSLNDDKVFKEKWGFTPLVRAKRRGLVRNACVVAGNSGDNALLDDIEPLLEDSEPLVRSHALWAFYKLAGIKNSKAKLEQVLSNDPDSLVRQETSRILSHCA